MSNEVIEKFYREHYKEFLKKVSRAAGTPWDAEDVVHDAFANALKYYGPHVDDLDAWMSLVLRNALYAHLNAERGIQAEELEEYDHPAECQIDPMLLRLTVEKLLKDENPDHVPILEFHFLKGYSAKEIQEFNSYSYPNTRKIIQRFRDKIKKEIDVT